MAKFQNIPPIKNIDELIYILGDDARFKDRCNMLKELEYHVNERISLVGTVDDIERIRAEAQANASAAQAVRDQANEDRRSADVEIGKMKERHEATITSERQELSELRAALDQRGREASEQERRATTLLTEAERIRGAAETKMRQAEERETSAASRETEFTRLRDEMQKHLSIAGKKGG